MSDDTGLVGCGCWAFVILPIAVSVLLASYLLIWTMLFGLSTPWGRVNLDIVPEPRIRVEEM